MRSNLFDKLMTVLALLIMAAGTIFVLVNWNTLGEQIPSHYDFKGQPDAYGGTGTLVVLMVVGWIVLLSIVILSGMPALWNTGVERMPANEAVINRVIKDMLNVMEVSIAVLFAYMLVVPVIGASMGIWFMPLFLALIFGNIIVTVVRLIRNR